MKIRLTWLSLDKDKLWYQHIFVYKQWRQTRTSVYWCAPDRRQYGGTCRKPKQRWTCCLGGDQRSSYTTENVTWINARLTRVQFQFVRLKALSLNKVSFRIWSLIQLRLQRGKKRNRVETSHFCSYPLLSFEYLKVSWSLMWNIF